MNAYAILYSNTHDAYVCCLDQTGVYSYKLQTNLVGCLVLGCYVTWKKNWNRTSGSYNKNTNTRLY